MQDLRSQIAYLHGLCEGMNLSDTSSEGRAIQEIVNVLDVMADSIVELNSSHTALEHLMDSMDEDITQLEEDVYEEVELDDDLTEDEDLDFVEVDCPQCNEIVCFESDLLHTDDNLEVVCPNCDEVVFMNMPEEQIHS